MVREGRGIDQNAAVRGGLAALGVALAAGDDRDLAFPAEADHGGHILGRGAAGYRAGQVVDPPAEIGTKQGADIVVEQETVAEGCP